MLLWVAIPAIVVLTFGASRISRRPQFGLLVVATLVPFDGLLVLVPNLPSGAAAWKETVVSASLLSSLVHRPTRRRGAPQPPWVAALLALVMLACASAIVTPWRQAVVGLKVDFFYVLLVVILRRHPFNRQDRDRLITILMITAFICACYGLVQQAVGQQALHNLGYAYDVSVRTTGGHLRSFSSFRQPFPFGLYEMVVLLVGIPVALTDIARLRNRLFLLASPVLVAGLLSSFVRAAYVGLAAGVIYLTIRRYRVLVSTAPVLLISVLLLPSGLLATALSSNSLKERSTGWITNIHVILSEPFGTGIGASGAAAAKLATLTHGAATSIYQPDNYYFKTAYELGVLGFWVLVLFFISAAAAADRAAASPDAQNSAVALGIAAATIAAALASTVATYLEIFPVDLLFWLLLGVVTCLPPPELPPATAGVRSRVVGSDAASRTDTAR